jgi:hypothetical protein
MGKPEQSKITNVYISKLPQTIFDEMPTIHVDLSDGRKQIKLFSYYHDEISFDKDELLGKTEQEAHALFHQKDVAYLQT